MQWILLILFIPYLYFLLRIYKGLLLLKPFTSGNGQNVFVSVIIACRNEGKNIPVLLNCLAIQDYNPGMFEVIMVDDNSEDTTFSIAGQYHGIKNIKVIKNSSRGKKSAIRTGIMQSSGDLIITTDADCIMGKSWISTIVSFFSENLPDMIIGPVRLTHGKGFFGRFQELEFLSLQGVTAGSAAAGDAVMCNGANLAFTREAYMRNSGTLHDEIASGDDIFLLHSLKKEPAPKILWLESIDACVTSTPAKTPYSFMDQRKRWMSKWRFYDDNTTLRLAIVTFLTSLLLICILSASFVAAKFILLYAFSLILKSIPDFLILADTTRRYDSRKLLRWFLPALFIYPLYVMGVVIYSYIPLRKRNISFPFPKGT